MSALEGFITGFAGTLATNVADKKKDARDYFNKQVEYARTKGLENRQRTKQAVNANIAIARQLSDVGVPKEVIMAQVNMDPTGLTSFSEQAEKIRAKAGRDLTADEWKSIYEVVGDFKAPDEDLGTFIQRTYDPIANAVSSESFKEDPKGSLISSMMGFSAMDEARAELGKTQIADGMTADQLIRYGDVTPQSVGGSRVKTNYGAIPGGDARSVSETTSLLKVADEMAQKLLRNVKGGDGVDRTNLRDQLAAGLQEVYTDVPDEEALRIATHIITKEGMIVDTGEGGGDESPAVAVEPPAVTGEAPVTDLTPIDVEKEPNLRTITGVKIAGKERFLAFVLDNADGRSIWIDQDGEEFILPNAKVRSLVSQRN